MKSITVWIWGIVVFLVITLLPTINLAQSSYSPPSQSANALTGISFDQAILIDESYRKEFEQCDKKNIFKGQIMPSGRQCSGDPNNVKALLRFPDGTVFFESKLSLDIDGSWKACKGGGAPTTQCSTSFNWSGITKEPNKFVDPDNIPYIVIPVFNGVTGKVDTEFRNKTGVNMGDVGIVIFKDKVIPVFVADGGPHNKLGEGSSSLFKLLGEDRCKASRNDGRTRLDKKWTSDFYCTDYRNISVPDKVLFFVFPKSKIADITPDNAINKVKNEALDRFQKLKVETKTVLKVNQPTSGQTFPVNTPVTFSGTAEPEVESIQVSIGPGGPFIIADLKKVGENWSFTQTFRNKGNNRPIIFRAFDEFGNQLQFLPFKLSVN